MNTASTKILTIDLDTRAYDIYIGAGLLYRIQDFLPESLDGRSVFLVTDENVESYANTVRDMLTQHGAGAAHMIVLPPGEKTKSFKNVEKVCAFLLSHGLSRNSLVFAVGGGVIGDLTGFCAAVTMRGVPYIQIPTTLLSQVDSSVGGKTGINTAQGKNLVGSFHQPAAVIADIETLQTLPSRELLAGYAEVLKYGLIQNLEFFEWLETHGASLCNLEHDALVHAIETSCKAKAALVEEDETEQGRRALLNFGHTFAHALEAEAGYNGTLLHGEAVAIGMIAALDLSARMGHCSPDDKERVEEHLQNIGLPTRAAYVDGLATSVDRLIGVMHHDKKTVNGQMVFVLSGGIGQAFISRDVPESLVREVLAESLGGQTKEAVKAESGLCSSKFSSL